MPGDMTYVFGNARSGEIGYEIPCGSVSLSKKISDYGEFRGTHYMDITGYDNTLLKQFTEPAFCFCVAERDGVAIWGGLVWSRTYQSDGKNVELYAKTYEAYPSYRYMPDFAMEGDQTDIFLALWNTMQGEAGSDLGIIIPTSIPKEESVIQTVTVAATDYQSYRNIMDQLANGDQGFDWTIDWARSGNTYTKTLRAQQPFLGAPFGPDSLTFDYPGNILNYWETDSCSSSGTNVYTMGAGSGDSMIVDVVVRQDLIDAGYVRLDLSVQTKTATTQDIIEPLAQQNMQLSATPVNSFVVVQKADKDPIFGSYGLGDNCVVAVSDAWHTTPFNKVTRIVEMDYSPAESDQVEQVQLTFEGVQADAG